MTCCPTAPSEHRGGRCDGWVIVDGEQVRCGCAGGVWVGRDDLREVLDDRMYSAGRALESAGRLRAALGVVDDTTEPAESLQIRTMHHYGFRAGQWATLIGKVSVAGANRGDEDRDCYIVHFPDGVFDLWPVNDPDGRYEQRHAPLVVAPTPPPTADGDMIQVPVPLDMARRIANDTANETEWNYLADAVASLVAENTPKKVPR